MKNRSWMFIGLILLCLFAFCLAAIFWIYIQYKNQPPSSLTNDSGYYIRGSKVYYLSGFPSEAFEIESANASRFQIIDSQYGLDDAHVYFNGGLISDADPSTLEVLDSPFSRDAKHVYASGEIFSDDPANFEILQENLSRDSQHIYWGGQTISDDPAHLVEIGSSGYYTYINDATTVYANGGVIQGADPARFEMITDGYSRDKSQVFYFTKIIPSADRATFEVMESPYARDAESVFWMEHIIPDAAPNAFRILNANFEC